MNAIKLIIVSVLRGLSPLQFAKLSLRSMPFLLLCIFGVMQISQEAWAAGTCSGDIGKVTINEYNNLGSNNLLGGTFIEVKLLPVPVSPSAGQAALTDISGWTLKSYDKNNKLLDTKTVSPDSVGGCSGTSYRSTAITLNNAGDGYVHLFDAASNLVDVIYVNVALPSAVDSCALSTITTPKDIQGADSNRKNVSRAPDGTGAWIMSLGNGNNSEQTLCADNLSLLNVVKTASVSSLFVGEAVTFTMTVSNQTQYTSLSNVSVIDTLPTGFTRTGYTAPAGSSFNTSTNTWTIATMAPGVSYTLTLTARADKVGSWTNSATGTVNYGGYLYSSNPGTASVTVKQPLTLTKVVSPTSVNFGGSATYTVTVTNNSSAALPAGFIVNDIPPSGLTYGTPVVSAGDSYSGGVWTISTGMPAGTSKSLSLPLTAPTSGAGGSFTNTATAPAPFGGVDIVASATLVVATISNFNAFETSTLANAISGRIYTKLSGTDFGLDVVAIAGGAQSAGFSGNVKLELLANSGTPGSGYGTDNCPTANAVIQTIASAAIAGGRSAVNFTAVANAYRDVRVRISYPTTTPTISSCSNDSFAIRPAAFTVTSTDATNTATTGAPAIKSGSNFNLTANANVGGGYLGTPVLDTALVQDHNNAAAGTLNGSFGAATGSNASGTLQYHDVGTIKLLADAVKDAAYTSIDQTADCVAGSTSNTMSGGQYGCNIGSTASGPFGRFYPDHFIYSATLTPACVIGNFSYMDQPTLGINLSLTAKSSNETTTTRYTAGYATLGTLAITGDNAGTLVAVSRLNPVLPTFAWTNGVYTATGNYKFTRNATPDGPYDSFALKAAVNDPDGALITGSAISNVSKIRFGRLKLTNVYGSELLNLVMPVQAQYWDGASFALNAADSCTALAAANVKLTAAPAGVTASGIGVLSSGKGSLTLTKPSPAVAAEVGVCTDLGADPGTGTVCLATSAALPFLQGLWSPGTSYNNDPGARATFGVYKGNNNFIYQRESY